MAEINAETIVTSNEITIDISSVRDEAKRSLSMMGKRLESKDGNTLFVNSTLSSAEEKFLMTSLRKGVSVFLGAFPRFVNFAEYGETILITFLTPLANDDKKNTFRENFINFVVEYIQFKVFGLSLTDEARKTKKEEMQDYLESAKSLILYAMSGPVLPKVPYTQHLSAKVDGSDTDGGVTIRIDEEYVTLSYGIDDGAIDDIESRSNDNSILEVHRSQEPHAFWLKPVNTGVAYVTLFSRHSDKLCVEVEVTVAKEV